MTTSKYLFSLLADNSITKKELVALLGYKNINKGLRRLDAALCRPQQNELFSRMVLSILGGDHQLFDFYLQQDNEFEFQPTIRLVPAKPIPKYPLYSRYAKNKELRMPMNELSNKIGYRAYSEPITLYLLESMVLDVRRSHGVSQKCSEIRFVLSNNLMVRMPVGGESE